MFDAKVKTFFKLMFSLLPGTRQQSDGLQPHNTATVGLNPISTHYQKIAATPYKLSLLFLRMNYFVITTSHSNQSIVVCSSRTAQSTLLIWKEDSWCSYLWGNQPYSHSPRQGPGWRFKCFFQILTLFALWQLLLLAECSLYRFIILELFFYSRSLASIRQWCQPYTYGFAGLAWIQMLWPKI